MYVPLGYKYLVCPQEMCGIAKERYVNGIRYSNRAFKIQERYLIEANRKTVHAVMEMERLRQRIRYIKVLVQYNI